MFAPIHMSRFKTEKSEQIRLRRLSCTFDNSSKFHHCTNIQLSIRPLMPPPLAPHSELLNVHASRLLCHSLLCQFTLDNLKLSEPPRLHANWLLVQDVSYRKTIAVSCRQHTTLHRFGSKVQTLPEANRSSLASRPHRAPSHMGFHTESSACYAGPFCRDRKPRTLPLASATQASM